MDGGMCCKFPGCGFKSDYSYIYIYIYIYIFIYSRNKVGGSQQKYKGQILVGLNGTERGLIGIGKESSRVSLYLRVGRSNDPSFKLAFQCRLKN